MTITNDNADIGDKTSMCGVTSNNQPRYNRFNNDNNNKE